MKISALVSMWMCAIFALLAFGFAGQGFLAVTEMVDAAERELSLGYAGFWAFLGLVATTFGILSWMIKEGKLGETE
jgi:hypothetical protein